MAKSTHKSKNSDALKLLEQKVLARTHELRNANKAAQNVLEDLQIEKEKLAIAKARDEALLGSIGDGVIATDEKGIIVLVNKAAEKSLERKNQELIGRVFSEAITMEDEKGLPVLERARPMVLALTLGTATTVAAADPTYYYVRENKTKFPVALTVTPVSLSGKVIGSIEVFRDITKEREVDRVKTEFVSLASHQLRTPLSSVRWYSDMLLDGGVGLVNEKQKQYLEEIYRSNLRMIALVNMLLNVSRLELGMAQVQTESVRFASIVAEVLQDVELFQHEQEVLVEIAIPGSLPLMMTDSKLIRIVVENLISNAIKYTGPNGRVKIAAEKVSAGEYFAGQVARRLSVGITISDNGIGIPEESQSKIFDKLFRAENAQEMDADGTGLGLHLTRLVLGYLKGEIWFTSRVGEGSSFFVLLPCIELE